MLKKFLKLLFACVCGAVVMCASVMDVSAATEEDVLNLLRSKGLSEVNIQRVKNHLNKKERTSEDYDWYINYINENCDKIADQWLDADYVANGYSYATTPAETLSPETTDNLGDGYAGVVTENTPADPTENILDFSNLSQEQKIEVISSASEMLSELGIDISIEQSSSGRYEIVATDEDGYVINATSLGTQIDATGIDYRGFAAICILLVSGSVYGIYFINKKFLTEGVVSDE